MRVMAETGGANPVGRKWWILAAIAIGQLMISLDTVVMNIALPSVQRDLHFGDSSREWVVTAYLLSFGSLLLLSGRLADRFGRRNMFVVGLVGFGIASCVGGTSTSFAMLVASRAVQGAFAAALAPAALALLSTTFPSGRDRSRAFGIFGAVGVSGSAIGLLIGGTVTQFLSWRWTMDINLVFAIPALVGGILLLPRSARRDNHGRIDLPGVALVSGGLFGLVCGVSNAPNEGWNSPATIGLLTVGVALLIAFVVMQRRSVAPLLPLRIPLQRNRGAGYLGILLGSASMISVTFMLTFYAQNVLKFSAVQTGLAFLPLPITLVLVGAILGPRLNGRFSPRVLVPAGMMLACVAALVLTRITTSDAYAGQLLPSLVLLGAGLGLVLPTSVSVATFGVRSEDAGVASALVSTTQQVGGAIAVAAFNTLATTTATGFLAGRTPTRALVENAAVHGYTIVFGWVAVLLLVGALATSLLGRPNTPRSGSEERGQRSAPIPEGRGR
jgi:EmrB/QacA subfamily drug resistance transporter